LIYQINNNQDKAIQAIKEQSSPTPLVDKVDENELATLEAMMKTLK